MTGVSNLSTNKDGAISIFTTGLPQAGKTTFAKALVDALNDHGFCSYNLDGDEFRQMFSPDLGFSQSDRSVNIMRAAHVASILNAVGVIAVGSFVIPFEKDRRALREHFESKNTYFFLIYIATPRSVCILRDTKKHYELAKLGAIRNFTGISDIFEEPENFDFKFYLETKKDLEVSVNSVVNTVKELVCA